MPISRTAALLACAALAGCVAGPPAPPPLAYGEETIGTVSYVQLDTTSVSVSVMGQRMEIVQQGRADWDAAFSDVPSGVGVSLSLRSLAATLAGPMGAPVPITEASVDGAVDFVLDRMGNATVTRTPTVAVEASQLVSGLGLAHTFFPALPGRAVAPGESWVDFLSFSGEEAGGSMSETSVLRYTAVGDTAVDGRSLLHIVFEGSTTLANELDVSGMAVSQSSEMQVSGLVLWDVQAGVMVEHVRTSQGTGTARVPIAPLPLPITVRSVERTRLEIPR